MTPGDDMEKDGKDSGVTRREALKLLGSAIAVGSMAASSLTIGPLAGATNASQTLSNVGRKENMKIVMLTGSPHKEGTTARLAEEFTAGATSKGHSVVRIDAGLEKVSPCIACFHCVSNDGVCVHDDAMTRILPEILSADMIVLVTPIYYYGMTAQLKTVLDRCFAQRVAVEKHPMKAALMAACGGPAPWSMDGLVAHYQCLCKYFSWEDKGMLLAKGMMTRKDIEGTDFPAQALRLGKTV